jgi:hypothetical protein
LTTRICGWRSIIVRIVGTDIHMPVEKESPAARSVCRRCGRRRLQSSELLPQCGGYREARSSPQWRRGPSPPRQRRERGKARVAGADDYGLRAGALDEVGGDGERFLRPSLLPPPLTPSTVMPSAPWRR